MKPDLHIAANGFLCLDFGDYDSPLSTSLSDFLETDWGFSRDGPAVFGLDGGVSPNFVRSEIVLAAGWDNWSGQYLLSNSKEGDEILRQIFDMISHGNESRKLANERRVGGSRPDADGHGAACFRLRAELIAFAIVWAAINKG